MTEKNLNSEIIKRILKANGCIHFDLEKVKFLVVAFLAKMLREREPRNMAAWNCCAPWTKGSRVTRTGDTGLLKERDRMESRMAITRGQIPSACRPDLFRLGSVGFFL